MLLPLPPPLRAAPPRAPPPWVLALRDMTLLEAKEASELRLLLLRCRRVRPLPPQLPQLLTGLG